MSGFWALVLKLISLFERGQAMSEETERQENRDAIESDPIDYANDKFGMRDDGEGEG